MTWSSIRLSPWQDFDGSRNDALATRNKDGQVMTELRTRDVPLNWKVFVTPSIPVVANDLPPGAKQRLWSPMSSTLIYGNRDAVLVDAFITVEQANALADWVAANGKNLTTIYATHGHGDHFFGATTVLERFPRARFVATPDVVKIMREQASPQFLASFWNSRFPGQISDHLVIAEELTGNVINLEGHVGRCAAGAYRY
jgi:glyoxylase-like metal-dependent hydrolase (beta-lactamase superfamily II)